MNDQVVSNGFDPPGARCVRLARVDGTVGRPQFHQAHEDVRSPTEELGWLNSKDAAKGFVLIEILRRSIDSLLTGAKHRKAQGVRSTKPHA